MIRFYIAVFKNVQMRTEWYMEINTVWRTFSIINSTRFFLCLVAIALAQRLISPLFLQLQLCMVDRLLDVMADAVTRVFIINRGHT